LRADDIGSDGSKVREEEENGVKLPEVGGLHHRYERRAA
jgi:hypothetical protein